MAQELIELIAALIAPYGLRPEATIHAIRVLRSSLHGFVTIEHLDGFNLPYDIDESFRCLIDVQLAGLKYWHYAVRS